MWAVGRLALDWSHIQLSLTEGLLERKVEESLMHVAMKDVFGVFGIPVCKTCLQTMGLHLKRTRRVGYWSANNSTAAYIRGTHHSLHVISTYRL